MKRLGKFLRNLRLLTALVAALIFFLSVLLPPILGLITQRVVVHRINTLQHSTLESAGIDLVQAQPSRLGWFSSDIQISAHGRFLSADGQSNASRTGILSINHGPLIWHLYDSPLALADIQLRPAAGEPDPARHFSGAAIATLTASLQVQIDAIAGINASGGEHWVELQILSPLLPFQRTTGSLWFDLDVRALNAAGSGQLTTKWQHTEDARLSNNRLLFNMELQ